MGNVGDNSVSSFRLRASETQHLSVTICIPSLFTVTSEHIRFYFLVFLFYTF